MGRKNKFIIAGVLAVVFVFAVIIFLIMHRESGSSLDTINIKVENSQEMEDEAQNYWNPGIHCVAKGEGGYYYLEMCDLPNTSFGTMLRFYDEGTKSSIPVCGKAECLHNSAECNAFFDQGYLSDPLHYYRGYLYMVKIKNGKGVLMQISVDGSRREEIAELFPNSNVTSIKLAFYDNCVYAYDQMGHIGSKEKGTEYFILFCHRRGIV